MSGMFGDYLQTLFSKTMVSAVPGVTADQFARDCVPVDVTQAAQWFYEGSSQEVWDCRADFPRVTPPWNLCWVEHVVPKYSNNEGRLVPFGQRMVPGTRLGSLYTTFPVKPEMSEEALTEDLLSWMFKRLYGDRVVDNEEMRAERQRQLNWLAASGYRAGWIVSGQHFTWAPHKPLHLSAIVMAYLDPNGQMFPGWKGRIAGVPGVTSGDMAGNIANMFWYPSLFAFSLLHCKNVRIEDIPVPPKVAAKRAKKGIPQITYKTLVVDGMREQVRRERDADPEGEQNTVKRALHICRGHFATYTTDAPLFGRITGTFWKPMHVRGSASAGEVRKDYRVVAGGQR